jgi:phage/plasmid-associated DNA primase
MWTGRLGATVSLVSNHLPPFIDTTDALKRRLVLNKTGPGSAIGHEDPRLAEKIISTELPGVLNRILDWCEALDAFEWPTVDYIADDLREMDRVANPELEFLEEMFEGEEWVVGDDRCIECTDFTAVVMTWREKAGYEKVDKRKIGLGLKAAAARTQLRYTRKQHRVPQNGGKTTPVWFYEGFGPRIVGEWKSNHVDEASTCAKEVFLGTDESQ